MPMHRLTAGGVAALAAACLALSACGQDADQETESPRIAAAVAEPLASLSDRAAEALEAGDECRAQQIVVELEERAEASQAQIPTRLRPELRAAVARLSEAVRCVPPAPEAVQPPADEEDCPPGFTRRDEEDDEDDDEREGKEREVGKDKERDKDKEEDGRKDQDEDKERGAPGPPCVPEEEDD